MFSKYVNPIFAQKLKLLPILEIFGLHGILGYK